MAYTCEIKVLTLREIAPRYHCDTPPKAAQFFREHVETASWFDAEKECLVVLLLNGRRHITGFNLVSIGTLDTVQSHPREVFRPAIAAAASALILAHNHPSGDPSPSDADIHWTHQMSRAGALLRIEILDHIIIGQTWADPRGHGYASLRTLGYDLEGWGSGYTVEKFRPRKQLHRQRASRLSALRPKLFAG